MEKYAVVLLEDSPTDQQLLREFAERIPFLTVTGVFGDTTTARPLLQSGTIDLLIADIYLPDQTAIDLLQTLTNPPQVIFTTASLSDSIKAYDLGVVDYLTKPFPFSRFERAINRVKDVLIGRAARTGQPTDPAQSPADFILLKVSRDTARIRLADIAYAQANGVYTMLHLTDSTQLTVSHTLAELANRLPASRFARVHRSYMVALPEVVRVRTLTVEIANRRIPIGSRYRGALGKTQNLPL